MIRLRSTSLKSVLVHMVHVPFVPSNEWLSVCKPLVATSSSLDSGGVPIGRSDQHCHILLA